jgi:DNA-binding YbaB/EbfC family protein
MKPGNVFKTLSNLKHRIDAVQKELKAARFEGRAGGGAVALTVSGAGELVEFAIDDSVLPEGADTVNALVKSAFADAFSRKEKAAAEALKKVGAGAANPFGAVM